MESLDLTHKGKSFAKDYPNVMGKLLIFNMKLLTTYFLNRTKI